MIRCILFNIGDVLTGDESIQPGRMLISQPGAIEVIKKISQHIPCYGVISSGNSSNGDALLALQEAGFSDSITGVFTSHSLGISKETPAFFRQICEMLDFSPGDVLMVGDHPVHDVLVPGEAGLWTCFYNPSGLSQYSALLPLQNAEISTFQQLNGRIDTGLHPSCGDCIAWLVENGTTQGILQHALMVSAVAYSIALRFVQSHVAIDPILVHRAGLLHDIDKLHPASSRERHGKLGAEILAQKGCHRIAEIVKNHVPPALSPHGSSPHTWEQKIVFYADKLVKHNTLVLMVDRIDDLMTRYPENKESYLDDLPAMRLIETEIMEAIDDDPIHFHDWMKAQLKGLSLPG